MKPQHDLEWYKQVLEEKSRFLMNYLRLDPRFFASMVSERILTVQDVEDLEVGTIRAKQ